MAIRHGRNLAIYVNGVDISGDLNEISPVSEQDMAEVATFGSLNHQAYAGLAKDSGTIQAIYNSTSAVVFQNLIQSASGYAMMMPFGSTRGNPIYCTNEINLKNNTMKSVVTDVNRATISFETVNYPFEAGVLLLQKYTDVASFTVGDSVDNSTSTLLGGAGYLQVFNCGSSGNIVVRILTSSTGLFAGEEATTATFVTISTSGTNRVSITGTIERYAKVTSNLGTATTATLAVGLVRY